MRQEFCVNHHDLNEILTIIFNVDLSKNFSLKIAGNVIFANNHGLKKIRKNFQVIRTFLDRLMPNKFL